MPDHWQETSIGEVASIVSERVEPTSLESGIYVGLEHLVSNARSLSAWGSTSDVSSSTTPFLPGDTLFGRLRPYLRKGVVAPVAGVCSPEILVLRAQEGIDPRFLGLIVLREAVFEECNRLSAGSRMPRTSAKDLMGLSVLIPPVAEQRRIADFIESIDWYIDSLQTQVEVTRAARSAVLFDLLSHLSAERDEARLIDVCDVYQPKTISKSEMQDDGAYVVYGANGPIGRFSKFNHDQPEVVVTCRGATCGTLNVTPPNVWITGNAMVVSPKDERLTKSFLLVALEAADLAAFISGSAQPQITRSMLGQLIIPVPPRAEQMEISKVAGSFDEQLRGLRCQLEAVRVFRGGVVAELLSGERLLDESYDVATSL